MTIPMKIEAHKRLYAASTASELMEFLLALGPKERFFFYDELPDALFKWFDSLTAKTKKSKHLPIQFASTDLSAAKYNAVDAVAVALGHLKHIYEPKLPAVIYRSILMPKANAPTTKVLNFKSGSKWSAMQSWTANKNPVVMDRDIKVTRDMELVLELSAKDAAKHVVTDYAQLLRLCIDAGNLAAKITKKLESNGLSENDAYCDPREWDHLRIRLKQFKAEREIMLYVPAGQTLKCTWRAYTFDKQERRVPYKEPI